MKKSLSLLFVIVLFITACKKSSSNNVTSNKISSQIVGTWVGVRNVTTYTDLSGKAQVIDNRYIYTYNIYSNGTASKTVPDGQGGVLQVYVHNVPYTITSTNGKNYINFYDNPGEPAEFDTYQIISVTDHSLVLNINYGQQQGNVIPGTYAIGTNAVLDEEYSK